MPVLNTVKSVSKTIKHPTTGAEIKRTAKVTRPVVFNEDGGKVSFASIEDILNFTNGEENLAKLIQVAIDAKAGYLGRLELSKAADSSKNLNKAVKAMKGIYGNDMTDEQVRFMLLQMPGAAEKFNATEIPTEVEMTVSINELLSIDEEAEDEASA